MTRLDFSEALCKGAVAFERIADLQEQISKTNDSNIVLTIKTEGRIGLTFAFMLGSLPLYAEKKGKHLRLLVSEKMYRLLSRINVLDYYKAKQGAKEKQEYQISFGDLQEQPAFKVLSSANDIIPFVNEIKMEVPVTLTDEMQATLTSRIGEIYLNALEHSRASVVLGGKYFKFQRNKYCFSCYDNGMGIPANVNNFFAAQGIPAITDVDALKWAMQKGNSTDSESGVPRGVGLDLLRSFAIENNGVIRICSGNALYVLNGSKCENYYSLKKTFDGTLFEMDVFSDRMSVG